MSKGDALTVPQSQELAGLFERAQWVVSAERIAYFQMPPALIGNSPVSFWTTVGGLYALVIPNTPRRGVAMVAVTVLLACTNILVSALSAPALRPYLAGNVLFCGLVVSAFSSLALYASLHFATLRRSISCSGRGRRSARSSP